MKKKGFTLVELLGILVILGVIAIITVPMITSSIKNSKEKLCETQKDSIKQATKNYLAKKASELTKDEYGNLNTECVNNLYTIPLKELQDNGFIEKEIKNPKTNQKLNKDLNIEITCKDNKYTDEIKVNYEC